MKQRTLFFVLLLLSTFTASAQTLIDGIYYDGFDLSAKTVKVAKNPNKYSGSVTIPSTVVYRSATYNVTEIGQYAFESCTALTSVTIGNSLTTIGDKAFYNCSSLTSVIIPNSVTSIGQYAFQGCYGLTSVTIGNSITSVGKQAFDGCTGNLTVNCNIPSASSYNESIFYLSQFSSLTIGDGVESIGDYAFYGCSKLTSVTIPNSVTTIGECAFEFCSGLTSVTIPNSVKSIGSSAFYACYKLTSVIIGNSVKSIGSSALEFCFGLTDVYCYAEQIPTTGERAISSIANATLHVPSTSVDAYKAVSPWSGFGSIVALDDEPTPEGIAIDETNFPDDNFRNWILSQDYGQDGILTSDELSNITLLSIPEMKINDLTGIEYFTALTSLGCSGNNLTTLDLTKNIALISLSCANNQLTSLDVSKNTLLTNLNCNGNQMTSLDVSECTALTELSCKGNRINSLNLSGCVALKTLFCEDNQLASLDVSKNIALESLDCTSNQLTSLDVSKNTALNGLYCSKNQLTSLDVSKSTSLTSLKCHKNQLTSINIFGCTSLTTIFCYQNQIKGKMMDTFIENLPNVGGSSLRIIYNEDEGNIMTTTQVASAREKDWDPLCYDVSDYGPYYTWKSYSGSEPTTDVLRGDANGDGEIGMPDVMFVVNYILSNPAETFNAEAADANLDGEIGMPDVMFIVNYILNGKYPDEDESASLSCPNGNHPHWIDLGLPSGTLWSCCNEGADTPYEYGGYYTWAQVSSAPTLTQINELIDNCSCVYIQDMGWNFTGPNGGSISLPAAGYYGYNSKDVGYTLSRVGSRGYYWSSTHSKESDIYFLFLKETAIRPDDGGYQLDKYSLRKVKK